MIFDKNEIHSLGGVDGVTDRNERKSMFIYNNVIALRFPYALILIDLLILSIFACVLCVPESILLCFCFCFLSLMER